ncbi:hypothetical protein ACFYUV_20820 [Nonomuraea sp. NPDC003560]|uniref:hypothetical protein n=1 Tax=Nonomuraea sp. NPDC003560 TaxID=3364341 RepID=UPI00368FCBB7
MSAALELVCRLVLPAKGRHGKHRRPAPLAVWPLADVEECRPTDLIPFAPEPNSPKDAA